MANAVQVLNTNQIYHQNSELELTIVSLKLLVHQVLIFLRNNLMRLKFHKFVVQIAGEEL